MRTILNYWTQQSVPEREAIGKRAAIARYEAELTTRPSDERRASIQVAIMRIEGKLAPVRA